MKKKIFVLYLSSAHLDVQVPKIAIKQKQKEILTVKWKEKTNTNWVKCIEVNRIIKLFSPCGALWMNGSVFVFAKARVGLALRGFPLFPCDTDQIQYCTKQATTHLFR